MVIEDRETLFKILKKKLKQNGKLFCLNAIEYEDIKNLYNNNKLISFFKFFWIDFLIAIACGAKTLLLVFDK